MSQLNPDVQRLFCHLVTPDEGIKQWLVGKGHVVTNYPAAADVLFFPGGSDVWPTLYGEPVIPGTTFDRARDRREIEVYQRFHKKIKVGICRGSQFLNVMCGGKLWQDVNNHTCGTHEAYCHITKKSISVTSTHHQMMIPDADGDILMTAARSTYKVSALGRVTFKKPQPEQDIEVVWYENEKALCYQPHPEYGVVECDNHFWGLFKRFCLPLVPTILGPHC